MMLNAVKIRDGHDNFFTPLRFIFAYMVLIGHAFVVIGGGSNSEPHIFFEFTFSYMAVNFFFIASGFLVTGSMLYRENVASFGAARFLRIYPGLLVHVLIMMLVFGPLTTSLPIWDYLRHPQMLIQPLLVLSFIETNMALPGILPNNHEPIASGTLWTLRYELLAYVGTLVAFLMGLLKHRWMLLAQFLVFAIALPLTMALGVFDNLPATAQSLLRFGVCYGLGAAIYGYRDKIKFYWPIVPALALVSALAHGTVLFEVLVDLTLAYMLFTLAYMKWPSLNFLKGYSDISYGLYIYHWAVLQGVYMLWPDVKVWQLIAVTTPIAIILSYLSWRLVEKPALALKKPLAKWLSRKKPEPVPASS